jgi:hypothetical protein
MKLSTLLETIPPDAEFPYNIDVTPKVYRQLTIHHSGRKIPTTPQEQWADRSGFFGSDEYPGRPLELQIETSRGLVIIPNPEVKYGSNGREREEGGRVGEKKGT